MPATGLDTTPVLRNSPSSGMNSAASTPNELCDEIDCINPNNLFNDDNDAYNLNETTILKPRRSDWNIKPSYLSMNTNNPIRFVVESMKIQPNPEKPMIPLSIGDPTTFGNLKASDETMKAVLKSVESGKHNGYAHTLGHQEARQAIARYSQHQSSEEISFENVYICSGCSSALEYCIVTLADSGQNILLPRPGFSLYNTLSEGLNIEVRYYNLLPQQNWQADLKQLESLIDENTAAVLINNPSNPCGSVFSKEHLEDIITICEKHYLPIIADEIYEHFVFPGSKHIAVSSLSKNVPVLACSGLTKRFLVPGWRIGWIVVHDREDRLKDAIIGLKKMCSRILGSNTLIQGAIPEILERTPQSYFDNVINILYHNAKLAFKILSNVRGLKPILPSGAMYMMIGIDIEHFPQFKDDIAFVQELVNEESVFCLPGGCFEYPNYFRIVLTVPGDMIEEACSRIAEFCDRHYASNKDNVIDKDLTKAIDF